MGNYLSLINRSSFGAKQMSFDGKWTLSSIDGLSDFSLVTESQRQKLMDDLIDKKVKITTEISSDEEIMTFTRNWASGIVHKSPVDLTAGTRSVIYGLLG